MKRIALLGSTGSIGQQTLDVIRWHPEEFEIVALVAENVLTNFLNNVAETEIDFPIVRSAEAA